jgi:hypothetical protein
MAVSKALTDLLEENLRKVQEPSSYALLRKKLMKSRPTYTASPIKQSPENSRKIDSDE